MYTHACKIIKILAIGRNEYTRRHTHKMYCANMRMEVRGKGGRLRRNWSPYYAIWSTYPFRRWLSGDIGYLDAGEGLVVVVFTMPSTKKEYYCKETKMSLNGVRMCVYYVINGKCWPFFSGACVYLWPSH